MNILKKIQNENKTDRIVRFILGLILGFIAYSYSAGSIQLALYLLAAILLITAVTGFCLIYKLLGISSLKK